jgi:hypothetical protein
MTFSAFLSVVNPRQGILELNACGVLFLYPTSNLSFKSGEIFFREN